MVIPAVEIGLFIIFVAALVGPFIAKRIEQNIEAYLLLMSLCAFAISRSWSSGISEEIFKAPVLVIISLFVILAGSIVRYKRHHAISTKSPFLDGIALKVLFLEIVVVLGLSASVITPIIPFFMLIEIVNLLPIDKRSRINLTVIACLSIGIGFSLTPVSDPVSSIAMMRIHGDLASTMHLQILELLSPYLIIWILMLGIISMFFSGNETAVIARPQVHGAISFKKAAILCLRASLFVGTLVLAGVAFGANV